MAEIATWRAIYKKLGWGKVSDECPTKAEILANLNAGHNPNTSLNAVISNADSYGDNECVKLEDLHTEQWKYEFKWIRDPSFDAPATGGEFLCGLIESWRVKYVDGVILPDTKEELTWEQGFEPSNGWYTKKEVDGVCKRFVPNNTTFDSKDTVVSWKQKYSDISLRATFTQAAGRKVYSSWSYNCRVDKTSFSYSGGQSNVTAKSASRSYTWNGQGSSYTESETATVRVSSPASISGNSISIPSNSGSDRNFTVTFYFPTATDQTISIFQEGGQVTYVDHLSIDPTTKNVPGSGQTFDVIVNANYDRYLNGVWQENIKSQYTDATVVSGSSSDITITRTSTGCSIKVAPNPNENSSRTYVVEFTYDSATPVRLTITQNEAVVSYPSEGYYLGQSRSSSGFTTSDLNVTNGDRDGGSFTVYYKSYRTKYVNGSQAGLEPVTPNIAPGDFWLNTFIDPRPNSDNVYTVEVRYQANNRNTERSTRITGSNGGATTVYTNFSQEARLDYFFTFDSNEGPTEKSLSTDAAANDFPFVNIYSRDSVGRAISFSISGVVPSWITCEIHENGVSVPAEIGVRLDKNPTHANRSATITLVQSHSSKTLTIKVSQAGRFYNLELLGSGVVYLWDNGLKPNDAISPTTKLVTNCPTIVKHQGSIIVNISALGGLGVQVGNGDRVNIYKHDGTWRFVTSFTLIQGDQAVSW